MQTKVEMLITTSHIVNSSPRCLQSQNIVTGSLGVLETIGKKTYGVIAEGDHGLKSTIHKAGDRPNLSKVTSLKSLTLLHFLCIYRGMSGDYIWFGFVATERGQGGC